jgi:hypothetical protein
MDDPLTASLDLLRRLPPQQVTQNLALLSDTVLPDLADDLLSSVDQPLQVKVDSSSREYLVSALFPPFSRCERAEGWRSMTASLRPRWGRTRRTRRAPLPGGPCWAELPYMYAAELCLPRRPATTTETATRTGQSTLLSSHSNQASEGVQPSPIMNGNMARLLLTARILHPIQLALDERV